MKSRNLKISVIEGLLVYLLAQALMVYRTASMQKHRSNDTVIKIGQIENAMDRKQSVPKVNVKTVCVKLFS